MIVITPDTLDGVIAAFACKSKYQDIQHCMLKEGASLPSVESDIILFNYTFSDELMYELNHSRHTIHVIDTIEELYHFLDICMVMIVKNRNVPEIQALFRSQPLSLETFESIENSMPYDKLFVIGANILIYENTMCNNLIKDISFTKMFSHPCPILNSPILKDRLAEMILQTIPTASFCCIFNHFRNHILYTLYSRGNFDVLSLVKQYNGVGTEKKASYIIKDSLNV